MFFGCFASHSPGLFRRCSLSMFDTTKGERKLSQWKTETNNIETKGGKIETQRNWQNIRNLSRMFYSKWEKGAEQQKFGCNVSLCFTTEQTFWYQETDTKRREELTEDILSYLHFQYYQQHRWLDVWLSLWRLSRKQRQWRRRTETMSVHSWKGLGFMCWRKSVCLCTHVDNTKSLYTCGMCVFVWHEEFFSLLLH